MLPPLYQFRIRSRVFRWYEQLQQIEGAIGTKPSTQLLNELDALDAKVGQVTVPLAYTDELYALRSYIVLVRSRLNSGAAGASIGTPATPSALA